LTQEVARGEDWGEDGWKRKQSPRKGLCLVIYAYGDDGSDEKKKRALSVSLLGGYADWWEQLESDWSVRCGGIPFHATDCESDVGDYVDIPHRTNKAMYSDLAGILAASRISGIAVAIDITARRKIFPNSLAPDYYRAFQECISRAAYLGENLNEVVEVTFDTGTENEYNAGLLYSYMRGTDDRLSKWLHPKISFVSWKESSRLQAADMLAFEAWKALDHTVGPIKRKRKSWEVLRSTKRFETLSYSDQWFSDLKAHIDSGELEKLVGFNESDYVNWLKKSGREHCTSNLIHFLGTRKK
jgi:hypothetical protein